MRQINVCKNFPIALQFVYRVELYSCMSNLSMGLYGKLTRRVVWYTFAPLEKVIHSLNNRGLVDSDLSQFINVHAKILCSKCLEIFIL